MLTDSIGDFLTRLRNAQKAKLEVVDAPYSALKMQIAQLLEKEGFVRGYEVLSVGKNKQDLRVKLKYSDGKAIIENISRVSKPGNRVYAKRPTDTGKVRAGLGFSILSTSKGILSDKEALEKNVGGEVLAQIW